MQNTTIIVKNIIGTDLATTPKLGEILGSEIIKNIKAKTVSKVDFSGLSTITTAFLNSSIGQLYSDFSTNILNDYVKLDGNTLTSLQFEKVKLVMKNAKIKLNKSDIEEEM